MINNMNSDLGKEQHSSTAAEALSLLLGIRYSKNQIFEKLKKQDCSIFHDNIKLTSNDLYISTILIITKYIHHIFTTFSNYM